MAKLAGIPIYQAPDTINEEVCRVPVGSVLEIVEEKTSRFSERSGRLADGRGWITISRDDEFYAHECMQPFAAGAAVMPGTIISGAALRCWNKG